MNEDHLYKQVPHTADQKSVLMVKGSARIKPSKFRMLTRLVIGGLALGVDELSNQMSEWEQVSTSKSTGTKSQPVRFESIDSPPQALDQQVITTETETTGQLTRYALIGLMIETEDRFRSGFALIGRMGNKFVQAVDPIFKPLNESKVLSPTRKRYNKLANRGQAEVSRWISLGREEEIQSRQLVQVALDESLDTSIEYLAENAEIQELIQSQGTGLANEIIEEIRERTVSADTLLENFMRALLWGKPRSEVPGPPDEVRIRALSLRPGIQPLDEKSYDDKKSTG